MTRFVSKLFGWKNSTITKNKHQMRPVLESLEDRLVMDATIGLDGGTLTVIGTDQDDIIQVDRISNVSTSGRNDGNLEEILQSLNDIPSSKAELPTLDFFKIRVTCATNVLSEPTVVEFFASEVDEILIRGNRGNDTIRNNTAIRSIIEGGPGNDTLIGGDSADEILGGDGVDIIYGMAGNDRLAGDLIEEDGSKFAGSNNFVYGGKGDDTIWGSGADDWLMGGSGADTMYGRRGNDLMVGDRSTFANYQNDVVGTVTLPPQIYSIDITNNALILADDGVVGGDTMYGGSGNDAMYGMGGGDTLYGGNDSQFFASGNDWLDGGSGQDKLYGEDGGDWLYGGDHDDELYGGPGTDNLFGEDGDDILAGGTNAMGGLKPDVFGDELHGGEGKDTIYFDAWDKVDFVPAAILFPLYPWVLDGEHEGYKVYVA